MRSLPPRAEQGRRRPLPFLRDILIEDVARPTMVMHNAGTNLWKVLKSHDWELPLPLLRSYTRDMLAGLEFLHSIGVAHRDVKPHNAVVDDGGECRLCDLGRAPHVPGRSSTLTTARCGIAHRK